MTSDSSIPFDGGPDFPWIPASANPWNAPVLDLRKYALNAVSMTGDPAVAECFAVARSGEEYLTVELPVDCLVSERITAPVAIFAQAGPLVIAEEMEDKWNVFFRDNRLFFARSWTGELVHSAALEQSDGLAVVTAIWTREAEHGTEHAVREVDYLIESYALGQAFPHPLPPTLDRTLEAVLAYSWSRHGRRGLFATYNDTLAAPHSRRATQ